MLTGDPVLLRTPFYSEWVTPKVCHLESGIDSRWYNITFFLFLHRYELIYFGFSSKPKVVLHGTRRLWEYFEIALPWQRCIFMLEFSARFWPISANSFLSATEILRKGLTSWTWEPLILNTQVVSNMWSPKGIQSKLWCFERLLTFLQFFSLNKDNRWRTYLSNRPHFLSV